VQLFVFKFHDLFKKLILTKSR